MLCIYQTYAFTSFYSTVYSNYNLYSLPYTGCSAKVAPPKFSKYKIPMTLFRVFGGGWVQSSTFFDFFSFHDYFVFIGLYASLYIGDKETYKKSWKNLYFGGFIPFDCLNSSKIFCLNALKIRLSFVKKTKNTLKNFFFANLKTWRLGHSKNLGRHVFFCQKFLF